MDISCYAHVGSKWTWNSTNKNSIELHSYESECCGLEEDLGRMQQLLSDDPSSLERSDPQDETTPLIRACLAGHLSCVNFLLSAGARAESIVNCGPLYWILTSRHSEWVKLQIARVLVQQGADPQYIFVIPHFLKSKSLLLSWVIRESPDPALVKFLLDCGSSTEFTDIILNKPTSVHHLHVPAIYAVRRDHHQILKMLLLHGAQIDARGAPNFEVMLGHVLDQLNLSLHLAVSSRYVSAHRSNKLRTLKILHQFGANFWLPLSDGSLPLEVVEGGPGSLSMIHRHALEGPYEEQEMLNEEVDWSFVVEMRKCMENPHTLQSLARLVILRNSGRNYLQDLSKLTLMPRYIIHFLKFYDC